MSCAQALGMELCTERCSCLLAKEGIGGNCSLCSTKLLSYSGSMQPCQCVESNVRLAFPP